MRRIYLDITNAGQDDGLPTSVLRELSHLRTVDHPNIAQVYEAEVKGEIVHLSFEYCDMNLKEYIKKHCEPLQSPFRSGIERTLAGLPLPRIQSALHQMLLGLQHCHSRGLMHRNMKPDNVLVTLDERVKISDFSLSRLALIPHVAYTPEDPKERERSGREARRLWYRAPEMLFRKSIYSFEVDMWSLGCLFAEMALGEPIFSGESEVEQLFRIFKFTGAPRQDDLEQMYKLETEAQVKMPSWKRVDFRHACFPEHSKEFKGLVDELFPGRESTLHRLIELRMKIGQDGLDLLCKMLDICPETRISAAAALQHDFFKKSFGYEIDIPMCPVEEAKGGYGAELTEQQLRDYAELHREAEVMNAANPFYMKKQSNITDNMRAILVDWLIDVSVHFEVMSETLHYAISYIDRSLSRIEIEKNKLQLIGVTCMKLADVFNEKSKEYYRQENASEYAYITAGTKLEIDQC